MGTTEARRGDGSLTARPIRHGGFRTVSFFAGLLGLDGASQWIVSAVRFDGARFEVPVHHAGEEAALLHVGRAMPDEPAFLRSEHLALVHRGRELPAPLLELLAHGAFRMHPDADLPALEAILAGDPDVLASPAHEGSGNGGATLRERIDRLLRGPDGLLSEEDAYADFLARYDVLCQKVISMWLFNPCDLILHADSECFGPPRFGIDMVMTITPPWDNRLRDRGRPPGAISRVAEPRVDDLLLHVTDVRDHDIITGSRSKERAIFEHVFAKDPGLVVFFHGCTGVVAGSDIEDVYREHKEKHHLPVLYFRGGENGCLEDFYREALVDVRQQTEHPADAPAARINLVGFSGHASAELLDGLGRAGLEVNAILLPQVTVDAVVAFEKAGANVYLPNVDFDTYYEQLRLGTGITHHIEPSPPYGFDGTERWMRAVAAEAAVEGGIEEAVRAMRGPLEARWRSLVASARGTTLTVVARDYEAEQVLEPKYCYGVPLLPTLLEMGFDLELLLLATEPDLTAWAREVIAAAGPEGHHPVEPRFFGSFDEMMGLLRDSPSRAVYSNFFFDWRATSAGKSTFSLQHFEPGFGGAVRTLERLLEVAGTSYYRRYGRYLGRDRYGRPQGDVARGTATPRSG